MHITFFNVKINYIDVYFGKVGLFMEGKEIAEKIKKLQEEIKDLELSGASPKQLAQYLVEVDKLTALMLAAHKGSPEQNG